MNLPAAMRFSASGTSVPALRYLPQIVAALLVVAVAWQAVQLTWLLRGSRNAPAANTASAQFTPPPPVTPRVNIQMLVNAHLFGRAGATNADPNNAPPTQVNLVLAGVMAVSDPKKGYAFIGETAANAKFHVVGHSLPGGVLLNAVYPDRVLLDRNGQLETLRLPKQASSFTPVARAVEPPPPPNFGDNLRRLAQSNPNALAEVMRPQPVFSQGVQRGYRVYPGRDRQQFAKLGLQPGDLITSVNGTPLDDPARGQEIINTISTSSQVSVTVERNGQPQQLTLNVAQISLPQAAEPAAPPPPEGAPARSAEFETH